MHTVYVTWPGVAPYMYYKLVGVCIWLHASVVTNLARLYTHASSAK
jgi:hypothetical protein